MKSLLICLSLFLLAGCAQQEMRYAVHAPGKRKNAAAVLAAVARAVPRRCAAGTGSLRRSFGIGFSVRGSR
jgi:hypothetical protein